MTQCLEQESTGRLGDAAPAQWTVKCVPLSVCHSPFPICRCPCQSNRCPGIGFKREMRSNCIKMPTQKHKNYGHTWRPVLLLSARCFAAGCHKQHACCVPRTKKDVGVVLRKSGGERHQSEASKRNKPRGSPHAAVSEIKLASPQQKIQEGPVGGGWMQCSSKRCLQH